MNRPDPSTVGTPRRSSPCWPPWPRPERWSSSPPTTRTANAMRPAVWRCSTAKSSGKSSGKSLERPSARRSRRDPDPSCSPEGQDRCPRTAGALGRGRVLPLRDQHVHGRSDVEPIPGGRRRAGVGRLLGHALQRRRTSGQRPGGPAGSDLADRLVTQFDDSTLGYSVAVNAFDFPYFKDGLSGIYFSEKDWAAHPPDRQFRLTQGRWPATAGEVTLAGHDFTDARGRPHQDTSPRPGPQGGGGRRQSAGGVAPDARGTRHLGADCPGSAGT